MLKVLFTYDYELFLGENHASAKEVLFEPTEKIAIAMKNDGAHGVFFADVCSAIRHREEGLGEYSDSFDEQLKVLTKNGHDVQLHLHPNWYNSKREGDSIKVSPKGYKIHEFGFDAKTFRSVPNIISETKEYLESVCSQAKSSYRCVAYRAGGFCVQPEQELFEALLNAGIVIDSSVNPHLYSLNTVNSYDFRSVPKQLNWVINPKEGISVASSKGILEIPIGTARLRPIEMIGHRLNEYKLPAACLKGEYVKSEGGGSAKVPKAKSLFRRLFAYRNLSLDTRTYTALFNDLEYIYKKHKLKENDQYVCLLCHPKLADQTRIDNIRYMIQELNNCPDKYQIVTCADVYDDAVERGVL